MTDYPQSVDFIRWKEKMSTLFPEAKFFLTSVGFPEELLYSAAGLVSLCRRMQQATAQQLHAHIVDEQWWSIEKVDEKEGETSHLLHFAGFATPNGDKS